jgi:Holliday junction resolvase RusA-like endonuclease
MFVVSELELNVDGVPVGQPRPRACVRGRHAHVYNPPTADAWRQAVRLVVRAAVARSRPLMEEEAVSVELAFRMPRPKSHMGTGRNAGLVKASAPALYRKKPDIDNLCIAVLNELQGEGQLIHDDSQVVALKASKRYGVMGESPGVTIYVETVKT